MFYRRKILLSLLQLSDNQLEKLRLQKLLFLLAQIQKDNAVYTFVPYKYGCFSFQANADLLTLKKYGMVNEVDNHWIKKDESDYIAMLKKHDRQALVLLGIRYGKKSRDELIKLTYEKFPFYAINSVIAEKYLSTQEIKNLLENHRSQEAGTVLFTIGYEGVSLEDYLNKLLRNNVKVLCDVRKNAFSMKYGFSKKQLQNACNGVGIKYCHFPQVGIDSHRRQSLKTQADYDSLFLHYEKETLWSTYDTQKEILGLLTSERRIALTCFESDVCKCHRKSLAEAITKLRGFTYQLKHI